MSAPPKIVEIAIQPKPFVDRARLSTVVDRIVEADPLVVVNYDDESDQIIVRTTDPQHFDVLLENLREGLGDSVTISAPRVAYREALAKEVEIDYTHKKQSGGSGQFGRVKVRLVPGERGQGIAFHDEIKGGNIPREYIPSVEKGMRETAETGSLIGFPIIDFDIHLTDGAYHDVDSSALAFEIAGRGAMREAAQKAGIKLLEPIMKVEVVTPEEFMGDVIGDLNLRRGQIQGTDSRGNAQIVEAMVPMATLFGCEKHLKLLTNGEAAVAMLWEGYAPVPPDFFDPDDTFPSAAALRA
jgi:elongation factor G